MPFSLTIEIVFWMTCAVAAIAVFAAIWVVILYKKINRLLGGTSAQSIESAQVLIRKELGQLEHFKSEVDKYLESVEMRLRRSVQGVETIRFNPFKGNGDGGNQSFSTAFVDEEGNGVVVSSLYSRERVSVFCKAVKNYTSEFELTDEERAVIANAKKKISTLGSLEK